MIFILAIFLLWALNVLGCGVSNPFIHVLLALGTLALIVQVHKSTAAD